MARVNGVADSTATELISSDTTRLSAPRSENIEINFSSTERKSEDYDVNTKDNLFLKEYFLGKAQAEGVEIPSGIHIKISTYNTSNQRDLYSGNVLKLIKGIQSEKYWSDFFGRDSKSIEDLCDEKGYTPEQKEKVMELHRFHDVRVNIFKARIKDMFNILSNDKETLREKVDKMQITDEQKAEIMQVKEFLDKYYKVEAEYNGKTYNLLNLTEEDKAELSKTAPQFLAFAEKMQPEMKKQAAYFAQKEMQNEELSDAGQTSRGTAYFLSLLLGAGLYKGYKEGVEMKEGLKGAEKFAQFYRENPEKGKAILDKCVNKFNKLNRNGELFVARETGELKTGIPKLWAYIKSFAKRKPVQLNATENVLAGTELMERYMRRIGMEGGEFLVFQKALHQRGLKKVINPFKAFKNAKGAVFETLLFSTFLLSGDDCAGAIKDFFQDQNNFGTGIGLSFLIAGVAGGIGSSMLFVPTFQHHVDYTRATKSLRNAGILPKLKGLTKWISKGKAALLGIPLGIALASTSSGSSWTSMLLTGWKMDQNGDELEDKNIISKEQNNITSTYRNMMEYDAYEGKKEGITYGITGDWTIGSVGGAAGVFTHANPVIQNSFTTLQGCSETLTASGYQILGDEIHNARLKKEKEELVASTKASNTNKI